jgi:Domain of unknown function (DUF5679)
MRTDTGRRMGRRAGETAGPRPRKTLVPDRTDRSARGVRVADTYEGYCVKCKEKREYTGEVRVSDSGRRMARGTCPVCGTTINRILGKA